MPLSLKAQSPNFVWRNWWQNLTILSVSWVGLSMMQRGSVPQLYTYLESYWRRLQNFKKSDVYKLNWQASPYTNGILTVNKILVRYVRESHLPNQVLKMGLRKKNMHFCLERSFSGDPVFRTGKFPLNNRWTQVVVKDSKVVFSFFLFGYMLQQVTKVLFMLLSGSIGKMVTWSCL